MIKRLRDTITTRLALLGVALAVLSLGTIAAIDSYYRATYRDETSAQMAAFSIQTFRTSIARLGPDEPVALSQEQTGPGPRYETVAPQYSVPWQGPFIERNIRKALGEPDANIEARNVPLSPRPLWIKFEANGHTYWVSLPIGVQGRPKPFVLLMFSTVMIAAFAGIAGYILVVLPIKRLRQTVISTRLNALDGPFTVSRREPREIQDVLTAFDTLMARLSAQAAEQDFALGAISHDLRSPLARLRMRLETQAHEDLRRAGTHDIATIDAVLSQFLAFVQGGDNLGPSVPIRDVILALRERYSGHPIVFDVAPEGQFSVKRDGAIRLVTNLIDNALAYGVAPIQVRAEADQDRLLIEIIDEGCGFTKEQEADARAPFKRLDQARSTAGSGLGLAIADRLAAAMGGTVGFERNHRGFVARVVLPRWVTNADGIQSRQPSTQWHCSR